MRSRDRAVKKVLVSGDRRTLWNAVRKMEISNFCLLIGIEPQHLIIAVLFEVRNLTAAAVCISCRLNRHSSISKEKSEQKAREMPADA